MNVNLEKSEKEEKKERERGLKKEEEIAWYIADIQ